MGMGIVPFFFTPTPQNHLNHKNHSQDGWVWAFFSFSS